VYDFNVNEKLTAYQYLLKEKLAGDKNRELIALLKDLKLAGRQVSKELNTGALTGSLGDNTGSKNTHGEKVKKLDLIANDLFIKSLENGGNCAGIVSEENEKILIFNTVQLGIKKLNRIQLTFTEKILNFICEILVRKKAPSVAIRKQETVNKRELFIKLDLHKKS